MQAELQKRVDARLVNAVRNGDLTIYNYSNHCVYERAWDEYTMAARGLVLHDSGAVVARPWPKFFNLGERPHDIIPLETPELAEKLDGSLVICFYHKRWRAITRGCWDNPQTRFAEKWLAAHDDALDSDTTYLFELIAPWNRIVIPYENEEMVLLGYVDTVTSEDSSYAAAAEEATRIGCRSAGFEKRPLDSVALDDPKVQDKEGFVARFSNGFRVKLKYQQYMALHKLLTGLSVRGIWELLAAGSEPSFDHVPDEFLDWYCKQRDALKNEYRDREAQAKVVFAGTPLCGTRKEYALGFVKHGDMAPILFAMLDGKDYSKAIWRQLEPRGLTPTFQKVEDN